MKINDHVRFRNTSDLLNGKTGVIYGVHSQFDSEPLFIVVFDEMIENFQHRAVVILADCLEVVE